VFYLFFLNQNMQLLTILGIAVALAMDAFAVAVATGVNLKNISYRQTFRLSWHFGLFQALMPIIGWWLWARQSRVISRITPTGWLFSC
jgi:putative Mn2+ efflux pump MntP